MITSRESNQKQPDGDVRRLIVETRNQDEAVALYTRRRTKYGKGKPFAFDGNRCAMYSQLKLSKIVHALKVKLAELRIQKGEEPDEIRKCNQTIEADMVCIEETIKRIDSFSIYVYMTSDIGVFITI